AVPHDGEEPRGPAVRALPDDGHELALVEARRAGGRRTRRSVARGAEHEAAPVGGRPVRRALVTGGRVARGGARGRAGRREVGGVRAPAGGGGGDQGERGELEKE